MVWAWRIQLRCESMLPIMPRASRSEGSIRRPPRVVGIGMGDTSRDP